MFSWFLLWKRVCQLEKQRKFLNSVARRFCDAAFVRCDPLWTKSAAITYRNLTVYLSPNSQYADARFFSIQAAIDLFGPCSPEVIATTNAWYAVGVGGLFTSTVTANFSGTPTRLNPARSVEVKNTTYGLNLEYLF